MAISHADHDHPNTPAARTGCRKLMAAGGPPLKMDEDVREAHPRKPAKLSVVPRTKRDGGVVKGLKASTKNHKRPGTQLRTIADLPDVSRGMAYGVRTAWAYGYPVVVGEQFNDTEARLVITGKVAEIALVWKPSLPHGVWGIFVRKHKESVTYRQTDIQTAFRMAAGDEPIG